MNINMKLTGDVEKIIEVIIRSGCATNKRQAIRLVIQHYEGCVLYNKFEKTKSNSKSL